MDRASSFVVVVLFILCFVVPVAMGLLSLFTWFFGFRGPRMRRNVKPKTARRKDSSNP